MKETHTRAESQTEEQHDQPRAAIYCRTSSSSQREGYSLDEQASECFKRCSFRGWEVIYVFSDEAESGKDTDRPMFQRMMNVAEAGLIDVIVVWKLDRFSRTVVHAVELEAELQEWGVGFLSVTEQIDTTTTAGRFNFRNMANVAEFERDMIKERSVMGMKARVQEGKWLNDRPPLGYKKREDGTLKIDEEERQLVEYIFDKYLEVQSMAQVAYDLNECGRTPDSINEWTARAIGDILSNELYMGVFTAAGISRFIPEYQIISHPQFRRVTKTRHRFRAEKQATQDNMAPSMKDDLVDGIVQDYISYVRKD